MMELTKPRVKRKRKAENPRRPDIFYGKRPKTGSPLPHWNRYEKASSFRGRKI
jgi:hypothetical protein